MRAHQSLTRSISTKRRNDSSTTVLKRKIITLSFFTFSTTTNPQSKNLDNRPDLDTIPTGELFSFNLNLSTIFSSHISLLYFLQIDYRKAQSMMPERGRNGTEHARHESPFLHVWKILARLLSFILVEWPAFWSKKKGQGTEI